MARNASECLRCGSDRRRIRRPKRYHYVESGLDNVYLYGGVEVAVCPDCGDELIWVQEEEQLLQVIAVTLLGKPFGLAGREMQYLRRECDLTQAELAKRLRLKRRETVAEREGGTIEMTPESEFWFRAVILKSFREYLSEDDGANCFLTNAHIEHVRRLARTFFELPLQRAGKARKTVSIKPVKDGWSLPNAA